jgi:hypothetical protein
MEIRTRELIERLSQVENRDEIVSEVQESYEEHRDSLSNRGYLFNDSNRDFVAGQPIQRGDLFDYYYYNELNFIINGLEDRWIANIDDYENYFEIENSIRNILNSLD